MASSKEKTKTKLKPKGFEQAVSELRDIVSSIENGESTLSEAVELYKKGVELSVYCNEFLNKIEEEVIVLRQLTENAESDEGFSDEL